MASHLLVAMTHETNQLELLVSETGQVGTTFQHKAEITDTFNEVISIVPSSQVPMHNWYMGMRLGHTMLLVVLT